MKNFEFNKEIRKIILFLFLKTSKTYVSIFLKSINQKCRYQGPNGPRNKIFGQRRKTISGKFGKLVKFLTKNQNNFYIIFLIKNVEYDRKRKLKNHIGKLGKSLNACPLKNYNVYIL